MSKCESSIHTRKSTMLLPSPKEVLYYMALEMKEGLGVLWAHELPHKTVYNRIGTPPLLLRTRDYLARFSRCCLL